ncbi:hypothetical protein ACB094_05G056000 [Castanea mollissima]
MLEGKLLGILAFVSMGYMNIEMEQIEEYVNGKLQNKYGDASFAETMVLKMDFQAFSFSFVGWQLGHMPNMYEVCHPLDDHKNSFQGEKDQILDGQNDWRWRERVSNYENPGRFPQINSWTTCCC